MPAGDRISTNCVIMLKNTLVPEVFREAAKKTSGNSGTESHFHATFT